MTRLTRCSVLAAAILTIGLGSGCANNSGDRIGKKTGGTQIGAGGGAVAGKAPAGDLYASHVAARKGEYASEEAWLQACLLHAQKIRLETSLYQVELRQRVAVLDKQSRVWESQPRSQDSEVMRAALNREMNENQRMIDSLEVEIRAQSNALAQTSPANAASAKLYADVQNELDGLKREKAVLETCQNQIETTISDRISD